ncbi:methyltransferase [Nocardioides sp. CFH 31398]|uniref:methyltransferase n=1 Tax=Nocardioides sp. CFH 31398 TaxID=2919579 RepID=UPI001F0589F1|nr:methyltransferase [Nocardioides sp. CFH 31398]MCH1868723.1 methyltransferase [Nocardioides sp. CFH 31398]
MTLLDAGGLTHSTFDTLEITAAPGVLEPRPWTAMQSHWAAELLDDAPPGGLVELCTGAGQIGLLAAQRSGRPLVAVDADPVCCQLVAHNAAANGIDDVEVRSSDLSVALAPGEVFALALADPPWVRSTQVTRFPEDPLTAIDGGIDGLGPARACVAAVESHLAPGASLLVQLGDDRQADALAAEAADAGWSPGGRRHGERGLVLRLRHG